MNGRRTTGTGSGVRFHRFVAIGDSTTEGLDDPAPDGGYRGWADRLAARLSSDNPELQYANLAVRGRYVARVRAEQLGPALALRPDLVSIIAGVNDLLRPRCDPAGVVAELDAMYASAVAAGATVVTITQPDPVAVLRMARPVRRRLYAYNEGIRASARRHGLLLVDFERMPESTHPLLWSIDRLHLNSLGHARMAATIAEALGLPPAEGDPALTDGVAAAPTLTQDAAWVVQYFLPWVWRHLRGRSSGDGVLAKRPALGPLEQSGQMGG